MATLRLGSIAPNFDAETTTGKINFHEFINNSWTVLFSHPDDFTPVCTTELGEVARRQPDFEKRGVKVIGLSCNDLDSHAEWTKDINELSNVNLKFPIIADRERKVAVLYDMLDQQDATNVDLKGLPLTVRSVFIIGPDKTCRTILSYPASTGRNFDEIIRIIDSLQAVDKYRIATPVNWVPGEKVIIHVSVKNDEAVKLFPQGIEHKKSYLRYTQI